MISYERFWKTLERKQVSTYVLREKHKISPSTLTRMRRNEYLSMHTIENFCKLLNCNIEDIVEYIPDKKEQGKD